MGELYKFFADLHVHTALSPCAADSATPPNIVASAIENGMQMIAVTDHNSAENVGAVVKCGKLHGLKVIPGMEIASREEGTVTGECARMLMGAADLSLEAIIREVHRLGGLAIAAHVDRPSFSVIANLGMMPPGARFDAVEISATLTKDAAIARFPSIGGFPVITASDAHLPQAIGSSPTLFLLEKMDLEDIRLAFHGRGGREYLIQ